MLKWVNDKLLYNGKELKSVVSDIVDSCKELNELNYLLAIVFAEVFKVAPPLKASQVRDEVQEILDEELYEYRFVR